MSRRAAAGGSETPREAARFLRNAAARASSQRGKLHRALRRERLEQRRCFGRRAALHHQQQRRLRHGGGVGGERRLLRGGQVAHDDDAAAVEKRQRFARGLHVRRRRRVEPLHVERARRLRRQRRRLAHRLLLAVFLLAVQQVRARKRHRLLRGRLPHGLEKPYLVHAPIIQESVPPRNARGLRRPRGIAARRAPAAAHPISGEIPPALPAPAARAPLPPRKKAGYTGNMKWYEIAVYTTDAGIEPVCGALTGAGLSGFSIEESREAAAAFLEQSALYWDFADMAHIGTTRPA